MLLCPLVLSLGLQLATDQDCWVLSTDSWVLSTQYNGARLRGKIKLTKPCTTPPLLSARPQTWPARAGKLPSQSNRIFQPQTSASYVENRYPQRSAPARERNRQIHSVHIAPLTHRRMVVPTTPNTKQITPRERRQGGGTISHTPIAHTIQQ